MHAKNKVVVVTGASMGIGEALAKKFVDEGANVVLSSRELARVEETRARLGAPERTLAVACDVREHTQIQALLKATLGSFGRVDVWINNAGYGLRDSAASMEMAQCRALFETNLFAAIDCMQCVIPIMQRQAGGTIINISSIAGHIAVPYMSAYCASKHALNAIGKAARLELKASGVHVMTVCPGYIATNFSANAVKGAQAKRIVPSSRIGPERVASAVFNGYLKQKREVVVPWKDRILIFLYQRAPRLIEFGMLRRVGPAEST